MKKHLVLLLAVVILVVSWYLLPPIHAQDALYGLPPHVVLFPKADGSSTGQLRFLELYANGENYVALKAPASIASTFSLVLPSATGTASQGLATDGSGNLIWAPRQSGQLGVFFKTDSEISQLLGFFANRDKNITITEVWCSIPSGVMSMNIQRDDGAPANVLASNLACAVGGASSTNFNAGENLISVGMLLNLAYETETLTAVAPINITVRYTVD